MQKSLNNIPLIQKLWYIDVDLSVNLLNLIESINRADILRQF